jgi:hypothetical protein
VDESESLLKERVSRSGYRLANVAASIVITPSLVSCRWASRQLTTYMYLEEIAPLNCESDLC